MLNTIKEVDRLVYLNKNKISSLPAFPHALTQSVQIAVKEQRKLLNKSLFSSACDENNTLI